MSRVPKIIHQTWKTHQMPYRLAKFAQTWQTHHPDYQYVLWTDDMIVRFLRQHEPQLVCLFQNLIIGPQKADVARYAIMKHVGGWYADLDTECLKRLDTLPVQYTAFGQEIIVSTLQGSTEIVILGSVPQHPLWDCVLRELIHNASLPMHLMWFRCLNREINVLASTGPLMFHHCVQKYIHDQRQQFHTIQYVPEHYFYAYPLVLRWWPCQDYSNSISLHKGQGTWITNPIAKCIHATFGSLEMVMFIVCCLLYVVYIRLKQDRHTNSIGHSNSRIFADETTPFKKQLYGLNKDMTYA